MGCASLRTLQQEQEELLPKRDELMTVALRISVGGYYVVETESQRAAGVSRGSTPLEASGFGVASGSALQVPSGH